MLKITIYGYPKDVSLHLGIVFFSVAVCFEGFQNFNYLISNVLNLDKFNFKRFDLTIYFEVIRRGFLLLESTERLAMFVIRADVTLRLAQAKSMRARL